MTYVGTTTRPRLGIDFAPASNPRAKGRDRRSPAASTTSEPKVAYRPLPLTDKKHPRLTGPGA